MSSQKLEKIIDTPEYKRLVETRSGLVWPLSITMLIVYYAYILVIAFAPELLAEKVSANGHTTYGIVAGLGVILFSFLITGIYVHKANTVLEPLAEKLHKASGGSHE